MQKKKITRINGKDRTNMMARDDSERMDKKLDESRINNSSSRSVHCFYYNIITEFKEKDVS